MIRFNIISSKNLTTLRVLSRLLLIFAILSIVLIIIDGIINGMYSNTSFVGKYQPVYLVVLIFGYMFIIIYGAVTKKYSIIGEMLINELNITVTTSNIQKAINVSDVENCIFKLKGYNGETPIMRSAFSYTGNFNYITIKTGNEIYDFEFYISDSLKIKSLLTIIDLWRKNGCNVEFYYGSKSY